MKFETEGTVKFDVEDGGSALISEIGFPKQDNPDSFFVRIQSYEQGDGAGRHARARVLHGKKVRITIDVID